MTMIGWLHQLGTLEFWEALLESFGGLGPIAPVILAMVESFFPPLPLIAIVALNVAAHGGLLGFVYSWAGVMLGGTVMFLLWRRVVKRFFWKFAPARPSCKRRSNGSAGSTPRPSSCCRSCPLRPRPLCILPSASLILTVLCQQTLL